MSSRRAEGAEIAALRPGSRALTSLNFDERIRRFLMNSPQISRSPELLRYKIILAIRDRN